MDQALALGLLRHALNAVGMWLAGRGYITEDMVQGLSGSVLTLASVAWFVAGRARAR